MSDDLSKLTPNDPSNLDPGWSGARKDILDGVLTEPSQRRRGVGRWVAGAAAAALIVVAIGGVVQQLRPEPYAAPASPSASVSPIPSGQLVAANDTLIDSGDGIGLCNGIVQQSRPPQCEDVTPVAGITWDDLDWASSYNGTSWAPAVLVGTFDGTTFSATRVYSPYDPEAPARPATDHEDAEFEPLCSDPVQGYGTASSEDALGSIAEDLPGFQSMWSSNDSGFYNIAVTKDVARAREILQESWSKPFCVGTLNGPTHTSMEAANEALREFTKGGGHLPFLGPAIKDRTHRLDITALLATPELVSELEQIVGPEVWPFTEVQSFYYPVLLTPDPDPNTTSADNDRLVAARDTLIETGTGMTLCNGYVLESRPPRCPRATPVTGVTWDDVTWAETADGITFAEDTIVVGTFEDDAFVATQVFRGDDPAAPQPPNTIADEELFTLCDAPTRGTGPDSVEDLIVTAENLPGYQALWVSPNQVTHNVAVTEDVEGARSALAEVYGGELCVGTVEGPTDQGLQEAELALEPLKLDVDSATTAAGSVWSTFSSVSTRGNRLEVSVRRDTPDLLDKIRAAVGSDVWPHTDVIPFFYPVLDSSASEPVATAPAPTPTALPQLDGTHVAQGGLEYRDGQLSLCYSFAVSEISHCTAAVPLFGLAPEDVEWEQGSVATGHAFTHTVVVGTLERAGFRVERTEHYPLEIGGVGTLPLAQDATVLASAAADLVASYDGDPFAPTAEVDESDPEGARLVVRAFLITDEVVADIHQRLGEDTWQYTDVGPFFSPLAP